jgi:Calcineurin-like phosphoesterase
MSKSNVIAIACADLHLSHQPPLARSVEKDWYKCMARQLRQLKEIQQDYDAPIICAGDVFDKWNSPPELINFAIQELPFMYCIPGQHDLPLHRLDDIKKSAYWTLFQAGKIKDLNYHVYQTNKGPVVTLWGMPWGTPLRTPNTIKGGIHIGLIHKYVWSIGYSYPGASLDSHWLSLLEKLKGYDFIISGDNHISFCQTCTNQVWVNCGGFFRRKSDEIDHKPKVWLLRADRTVTPFELDVSKDMFLGTTKFKKDEEEYADVREFINELKEGGIKELDFREAVIHYMEDQRVSRDVRQIVLQSLETK